MKALRTWRLAIPALAMTGVLNFAPATQALADQVEGRVSKVSAGASVSITVPDGTVVAPGDPVTILADIPGLGLTAIATPWTVDSFANGVAVATPQSPPTGAPQVGYTARIETDAVAGSAVVADPAPDPETGGAQPGENQDVTSIYLRARQLSLSDNSADHGRAAILYRQAADMQHGGAMTALGALYGFGRGMDRDDRVALDWHRRAAKLGDAEAMLRLGLIYLTGRGVAVDERQAAARFRLAAAGGNAQAMYILALLHEDGIGVEASMTEMVRWLEQATRAGHLEAMYILGEIYEDGEDGIIAADIGKAERYRLAAANAGHVGAMEQLADFYLGRDAGAAERWSSAARNTAPRPDYLSDPRCLSWWECYLPALERAGDRDTHADVQPMPDAAGTTRGEANAPTVRVTYVVQDCDRIAATPLDPDRPDPDLGVPYAQLNPPVVIAECNADIAQWPDTARFYAQIARGYHKAGRYADAYNAAMIGAEMGSGQAMAIVGALYRSGQHVAKSPAEALRWLEKAGFAGNIVAMHFAASMHLNAEGVPYNARAAAEWYQAAADHGNGEAMANLGVLYDNGQGVAYDSDEAAANLMAGLAMGSDRARDILLGNPNQLSPHTRKAVQLILRNDGLYTGALDGAFGPQTLRALRARIPN
ncbi:tetratricopeptide repeat protein [Thalassovita aquimarina]|uniref:Sel1 repeat family protein n=1 Tax=Thalassovita aquimarina TaxID=2785917 RepID=A0ABS5HQR4_9RHOB|nr:tetratricopeptide repeat protein [Thalassovita aquimarina]MBR9651289.1 sel1 repeat family protein [Thalassovita aquimarina]